MSHQDEARRNPLNTMLDNFQARMVAKKIKDAMEETEVRNLKAKAEREQRERDLADAADDLANDVAPEDGVDDNGVGNFTIGNQEGKVLIVFPKPVDWLGFDPDEAELMAMVVLENVAAARAWTPPAPPEGAPDGKEG